MELDSNNGGSDWVRLGRTESVVELARQHLLSDSMVCVRAGNPTVWIHRSLFGLYGGVQSERLQVDQRAPREEDR